MLCRVMVPRGIATVVMAVLPASAWIPNTESFSIYALTVIPLGVLGLTVARALHPAWLRAKKVLFFAR